MARALFEGLALGLVRWLTRNAAREAALTMALLDAIIAGLGQAESGALRELCARGAAEFLRWSVKHVMMPGACL